jgi:hypothetical protein
MANERKVGNLLVQMRAELGGLKTDVKDMQRTFESGFTGIQRSAVNLGKAMTAAFSIGAIVSFSKGLLDLGGKIQDISERTKLSGQLLSGMTSILEEGGVSLEQFAKGIQFAQKNLGQMDDDGGRAAVALKAMGLNTKELIGLSPDEFLRRFSEALAKVENQNQRTAIATAVLGKAGADLVPVVLKMAGGFDKILAGGLSNKTIASIDELGDSWTRLKNKIQLASMQIAVDVAKSLGAIERSVPELEKEISALDKLPLWRRMIMGKDTRRGILTDQLAEARQAIDDKDLFGAPKGGPSSLLDLSGGADKKAEELKKKVESFLEGMKKQGAQLGVSLTELTKGPVAGLIEGLEQAFQAAGGDKIPGARAQFNELSAAIVKARQELDQAKFSFERLDEAAKRDDQDRAEWLTFAEDVARVKEQAEGLAKALLDARIDALAPMFSQDSAEWLTVPEDTAAAAAKTAAAIAQQADAAFRPWENVARDVFGGIHTAFQSVMMGTQSLSQAFANMGMSILQSLNKVIFEILVVEPLIKSLRAAMGAPVAPSSGGGGGGAGAGLFGLIGGFFSWLFGHQGGLVTSAGILKMHSGGEIPAILQSGEFVMQRPAVGSIGVPNLAEMNRTGRFPGGGGISIGYIDARGAQRGVSAEIWRAIKMSEDQAVKRSVGEVKDERGRSNNYARSLGR